MLHTCTHTRNYFSRATVSSVTGSNVALPCEVDILKCGKISQILWSKNFSTVWKPILTQTYHHQSEQQQQQQHLTRKMISSSRMFNGAGQVDTSGTVVMSNVINGSGKNSKIDQRFTLDTKSNTSHALLRVTSVTIQDEGLYKCDITYVQPTCPSITYVKLHTMGKLSSNCTASCSFTRPLLLHVTLVNFIHVICFASFFQTFRLLFLTLFSILSLPCFFVCFFHSSCPF